VDLEGFEVNVRADLYGTRLVAGIQRTRDSLGNRVRRGKALRSSLRPTVAAAMLRLAGAHRGPGRLADPLCGAAVIPVEAARVNPELEIEASDWDAPTVEVARATLRNHGLEIPVRVLDARALGASCGTPFDYIVTDPPYGMRQAKRARLTAFYRELLESFTGALAPAGRIVVIVVKHRVFEAALERTGLRVAHRRPVVCGSIRPRIFVLERPAGS
jgi:putative N6-adenine-specific DNA methylase/tRNA (guanine6-N2)-methyltransferase